MPATLSRLPSVLRAQLAANVNRLMVLAVLAAAALACLFLVLCAVMVALWFALLPHFGPAMSALLVAGLPALLVLILATSLMLARRRWRRRRAITAAKVAKVATLAGLGPLPPLLAAIVAFGFMAGRNER